MMGAGAGVKAGAGTRTGAVIGAGAGTGAQAFRTALKILYKSFSEYLEILVAAEALATGSFAPEGPAGLSNNSSPDSGGGEES